MSNSTDKANAKAKLKEETQAKRYEDARIHLLNGFIRAISVDTCIFTEAGYSLEAGNLKYLEQFKGNPFKLVFSEVTLKEIVGHLTKHADDSSSQLRSALRQFGKYWNFNKDQNNALLDELTKGQIPKERAISRVNDFVSRCGAHIIKASETLDVTMLLDRYFTPQSPFETSKDKKAEFPDAITLISLQAWAAKEDKGLLVVTKDEGAQSFCDESKYLFAINSLSDALSLIQQRNSHAAELCRAIEEKINTNQMPDMLERIQANSDVDSIYWQPEAASSFYFDAEMYEVKILDVKFAEPDNQAKLSVVDYNDSLLVARATVDLAIKAICEFSFFVKDGIDRDMVRIGDTLAGTEETIEADVLLSFINAESEYPELVSVELVPSYRRIDFGNIEPDYSEDPESDYY